MKLLSEQEVSEMLRLSVAVLRKWRLRVDKGPVFRRLNGRAVRYVESDVHAWVNAQPSGGSAPTGRGGAR